MTNRPIASAVLLMSALVAAASGGDEAAKLVYRLDGADGKPSSADQVKAAVDVLKKRFSAAGLVGIEVAQSDVAAQLTIAWPTPLVAQTARIVELAERPGTIEFRLRASAAEEKKYVGLADSGGTLPAAYAWAPSIEGGRQMLVETPERPLRDEVKNLEEKGVAKDSAEYKAAVAAYETSVRDNVFTGDQIARAEVRRQPGQVVVFFAFKDERKPYFATFTEKHIGRDMAIIIDGKVDGAPRIMSKLPGEGLIEGGHGPKGFIDHEAPDLVAVLSSGAVPGRLVRVNTPEPK